MSSSSSKRSEGRSLFVLRDADALGITLEEANGRVRVKTMQVPGLGGLYPMDGIQCSSLEAALNELLDTRSRSVRIRFTASDHSENRRQEKSVNDIKFMKRGDALCAKEKFMEAVATYGLVEEEDALVLTNRCTALQLSRRIDEASVEANRLIQRWSKWEMGYVRKAACQVALQDIHGAVRTLAQGLIQLPDNPALLWRMRSYIPERERDITCLGNDPDTIISVLRTDYFKSSRPSDAFAPATSTDTGMRVAISTFNPLVPMHSIAVEVNGVPAESCPFAALKQKLAGDLQAVVVIWHLPSIDNKLTNAAFVQHVPSSIRLASAKFSSDQDPVGNGEMDERQIALRLSAVPQSFDQVIVFGAGEPKCNGDYYPQGTRNERPWFENEFGIILSYEQAQSGQCGWVLGDPTLAKVFYVLRPGHEPRGEDFGQWLTVDPDVIMNPAPSFVGVGDRVLSLKKLTTWIRDTRARPGAGPSATSASRTMISYMLALKGHGIRLLEGGWEEEAVQVFDLIIDQALALAVGDDRCPSVELARLSESAKTYKLRAVQQLKQSRSMRFDGNEVNLNILFDGVSLNLFDDQSRQVTITLLDEQTLSISERAMESRRRKASTVKKRKSGIFSVFGCMSVPPPPPPEASREISERWGRDETDLETGAEGVWKKLILTNKSRNKSWELSMPHEDVIKALRAWKGMTSSQSLREDIGWI